MIDVEVVELLVSPAHRLAGRPSEGPAPGPDDERVTRAEVRARLGLVGDRYFAQAAHRDASVTMMSVENLPTDVDPAVDLRQTRRNVLLRGVDVDALVGATVSLDCGEGPVRFSLNRPARPCAWMNVTVGPAPRRHSATRAGCGARRSTTASSASGRPVRGAVRAGPAPSGVGRGGAT